ncbi:MAG: hypothetical protein IKE28_01045 [Solobacterium sp.]|nr:hypothetical protein [Solobacterium sp.]
MMIQRNHIAFHRVILTAVLSVSILFLPGCTSSRSSDANNTTASNTNSSSKQLRFEAVTPVSIGSVLKDRNQDAAEELLAGFDWFYVGYMDSGRGLDYMPAGAVRITDLSKLDGEWIATHYRYPDGNWQKQILKADLETNGKTISYTEEWQYLFYSDGKMEDARTAAHDLPYSGTAEADPLTLSLTEEYFNNKLTYTNIYEYNGFLYALGTYYSDYDGSLGYAAMCKASDTPASSPSAEPVITEKPEVKPAQTQPTSQNGTPETVSAPSGLEFLEDTWKGGNYYFTIRFLEDGRLNYIQYSIDPLGDDTGFGGLDAHYVTYSYCDYTFDSSNQSVTFTNESNKKETVVLERVSNDSLKVSTYTNSKLSDESTVSPAEGPTVFVPLKN